MAIVGRLVWLRVRPCGRYSYPRVVLLVRNLLVTNVHASNVHAPSGYPMATEKLPTSYQIAIHWLPNSYPTITQLLPTRCQMAIRRGQWRCFSNDYRMATRWLPNGYPMATQTEVLPAAY